jgi:hypothetical protein
MSGWGELQKHGCSGTSGHTHRLALNWYTTYSKTSFWLESGCLCDVNPDYIIGGCPDWKQGCALITVEDDSAIPEIIPMESKGLWFRGAYVA